MARDQATRRRARTAFIYEHLPLTAVSTAVDVPIATLRRWKAEAEKQGDDWDVARTANIMAGTGMDKHVTEIVQAYLIQHQATIAMLAEAEDIKPAERAQLLASLADSFNKTVSAAKRIAPQISELGVAMDVMQRLAAYVTQHHPAIAPQLLEVLEPFGQTLTEAYK